MSDITELRTAVIQLASIKLSRTEFMEVNDLHVNRFLDLHSQIVALTRRIEAIEQWTVNHITGNAV